MPGSSKPPPTVDAPRAPTARELFEAHRELVLGWPQGIAAPLHDGWQAMAERLAARAGLQAPPVELYPPGPTE